MNANPERPEVDDPRVLALAKARQQIAYESPLNFVCPPWDGLTEDEQQTSLLDARNYLNAAIAAGLVPAAVSSPPATDRATLLEQIAGAVRSVLPMSSGLTHSVVADAVLAVLPPPAARAAVLLEVADWLMAWRPEFFERWAVVEQDRYEGGVDDAAAELRRLAAEAQQPEGECPQCGDAGACAGGPCPLLPAVGAKQPDPGPGADLIEGYLRFLRGQGPEPDLTQLTPEQREAAAGQFEVVKALADRGPGLPPLDRDPVARRLGLSVPPGEAQQEAPWATDGARIGRVLIWSWARVSDTDFGQGYRTAQEDARAILTRPLLTRSTEAPQPEPAPTLPTGWSSWEALLLNAVDETWLRSQGVDSAEELLAAVRRAQAVGARQPDTETREEAGVALARHIADRPLSEIQAAIRILGWPPLRFELVDDPTGDDHSCAEAGCPGEPTTAGGVADETGETVHGCPPDGSGLTPCCGRTPFELPLGDRISSEAPITCQGSDHA